MSEESEIHVLDEGDQMFSQTSRMRTSSPAPSHAKELGSISPGIPREDVSQQLGDRPDVLEEKYYNQQQER